MLRQHIEKEDHCLFPMADEALTDSDQWQVLESSARADEENGGDAQHDKYLAMADRLADRYGVPKDALERNAGHCCG